LVVRTGARTVIGAEADVQPRVDVALHDDWELNGDGSGSMERLMLDPARRLLDICDRFGARYSLFAEIGQQLTMRDSASAKHRALASAWERTVIDAVRRGHDVQLHLHPQWLGATHDGTRWRLNHARWNTGRLAYDELLSALAWGRDYLHDLVRPHVPSYRVCAFRAGGWMCQPSTNLSRALQQLDIRADVTVVKGRYKSYGELGAVDFRHAPSGCIPWRADEHDFAREAPGGNGILVIPTYAELIHLPVPLHLFLSSPLSLMHYLRVVRSWRQRRTNAAYSPPAVSAPDGISYPKRWIGQVFRPRSIYASFNYMHHRTVRKMVERVHRIAKQRKLAYAPMIMLAHSKSFYSYSNFEKLLTRLSRTEYVRFATTQDIVSRSEALFGRAEVEPCPFHHGEAGDRSPAGSSSKTAPSEDLDQDTYARI
jgi:hypothetical protein